MRLTLLTYGLALSINCAYSSSRTDGSKIADAGDIRLAGNAETVEATNVNNVPEQHELCQAEQDTSLEYRWFMQNRKTGLFLTATECSNKSCSVTAAETMSDSAALQFTLIGNPRIFVIKTQNRTLCLEENEVGLVNFSSCCANKTSQQWRYMGKRHFEWCQSVATGKYLDAGTSAGFLETHTEKPGSSQIWISYYASMPDEIALDKQLFLFNENSRLFVSPSGCKDCPVAQHGSADTVTPWHRSEILSRVVTSTAIYQLKTSDALLCLEASTSNSSVFMSQCCGNSGTQQWYQINEEKANTVRLTNVATSKSLCINESTNDISTCTIKGENDWRVTWSTFTQDDLPFVDTFHDNHWYLATTNSPLFLKVSNHDGKIVAIEGTPNASLATPLQFSHTISGAVFVKTTDRHYCLAVRPGSQVAMEECTIAKTQQWLQSGPTIKNAETGEFLALSKQNRTVVVTSPHYDDFSQWSGVYAKWFMRGISLSSHYQQQNESVTSDCCPTSYSLVHCSAAQACQEACKSDKNCTAATFNHNMPQNCNLHGATYAIDFKASWDWAAWFKPAVI